MKIGKLPAKTQLVLGIPLVIAACSSARSNDGEPPTAKPAPRQGPQPDFGPLVQQQEPPPPISGGTLAVSRTDGLAVAADPDRDRVYVVDLPTRTIRHSIQLAHRSEPGRVALDASGRAHVALRNTGELATIDLATGKVSLRHACTAPRGVTFDAANDQLWVACATGDLLTFATDGGPAKTKVNLGLDLRDVVVTKKRVLATRFRSAHVVPAVESAANGNHDETLGEANLAWRAVAAPTAPDEPEGLEGEEAEEIPAVVTQEPSPEPVRPEPGGYGSPTTGVDPRCSDVAIVSTRLWLRDPSFEDVIGQPSFPSVRLPRAVLPVDLATNGREFVVVAAGNAFTPSLPQLFVVHRNQLLASTGDCVQAIEGNVPGQAIAAGFDDKDQLVVQTREPAALHIMTPDRRRPWKSIVLASDSRADTGHAIFHANAGGNIACASCHAEGGDDGKTWEFVGMGPRRTPSLLGTTPNTEPFHWVGDMKDLKMLVEHVFVERMGGPRIDDAQVDVLGKFLFTLPPPPKLRNPAEAPARGKELFDQRCASCHSGPLMTNNQTVDVGTGGAFQVPSLVGVAWRAPFIHTGCAKTLFDRFDPACGGAMHGDTRDLSRDQIADLVRYLETL